MIFKSFCFCVVLLFHSIEIIQSQSASTCTNVTNANKELWRTQLAVTISTQRYDDALEMVQCKEPTVIDWMNIINIVYNPRNHQMVEPLISFGLRLHRYVYNTRLLYFFTLRNYLETRKQNSSLIRELFQLRNKEKPNNFQERLRNNPYLNFIELEEKTGFALGNFFGEFLLLEQNADVMAVLTSIKWATVARIELEGFPKGDLMLVQNVLNQTVLRVYRNSVNISKFIDKAEIFSGNLHNDLLKTYILGAVHYAVHQVKDDDQPHLFKLAYAVKKHFAVAEHVTRDISDVKDYMSKYVEKLLDTFHGCVKSIINQKNPQTVGYLIKNKKYAEYLYVVHAAQSWKTQAADVVDKSNYRAIFTYIPKNDMNTQGQWILVFENDHFWIRSAYYPRRQLDTTSAYTIHASTYTTLQLKSAVRIIPSQNDNESCYIENYETHRRIYAGGNDKLEDASRRAVYVGDRHLANDDSLLWSFSTYRALP